MPIGIITGLEFEATLCRKAYHSQGLPPPLIASGQGRMDHAVEAAKQLLAQGADALVSFGVCGGLGPGAMPGQYIIPTHVIAVGEPELPLNTHWSSAARQALSADTTRLLSVDTAVTQSGQKHALFQTLKADAVDVESYVIARTAHAHNRPCLVIRAVLDPVTQSLPSAALRGVDAQGRTRIGPVLLELARQPGQLPDLIRLGRQSSRASQVLREAVLKGAPDFWRAPRKDHPPT